MRIEVTAQGRIFNTQRYSIQDGPGIRTMVFLKGCPLRCQWCSNPESQVSFVEMGLTRQVCTMCGRCVKVCPSEAISLERDVVKIDRDRCTSCGKCVDVCYPGALKKWGADMPVLDVLEIVGRDRAFYRNSGGGVTLSGGEPLSQPEFAKSFLRLCQESGLHTCVETSGFCEPRIIEEISAYVDLFFYDLKHMDATIHREYIGQPNQLILDNARLIASAGRPMVIRIPLIPGINDSVENISSTCRFVRDLKSVDQIDLLPYHRYGMNKYTSLDRPYLLAGLPTCSEEIVERARRIIVDQFNFKCQVGG